MSLSNRRSARPGSGDLSRPAMKERRPGMARPDRDHPPADRLRQPGPSDDRAGATCSPGDTRGATGCRSGRSWKEPTPVAHFHQGCDATPSAVRRSRRQRVDLVQVMWEPSGQARRETFFS